MSTGQNCMIVTTKAHETYLILEQEDAPRDTWDWRDYADFYGPFANEAEAEAYLKNSFANPGSVSYQRDVERDENLKARAQKPGSRRF